jgi:rhodanese-related sulfurtransferase
MNPKEAFELMQQGKAVLVDCREANELKETGTPEGALWMPMSAMVDDTDEWRDFKKALPHDKTIVMFCKLGGRSGRMCEFLACDGFKTVNLGGFSDWKSAGLPVRPWNGK